MKRFCFRRIRTPRTAVLCTSERKFYAGPKESLACIYRKRYIQSVAKIPIKMLPSKSATSSETLIRIYECLCDETRLRIVNLLTRGPLCVCHLQDLLESPQVKISKHLRYLKDKGMLEAERHQNWMIYSLPANPSHELEANLKCLQDVTSTNPVFKTDLKRLDAMKKEINWLAELAEEKGSCCGAKKD